MTTCRLSMSSNANASASTDSRLSLHHRTFLPFHKLQDQNNPHTHGDSGTGPAVGAHNRVVKPLSSGKIQNPETAVPPQIDTPQAQVGTENKNDFFYSQQCGNRRCGTVQCSVRSRDQLRGNTPAMDTAGAAGGGGDRHKQKKKAKKKEHKHQHKEKHQAKHAKKRKHSNTAPKHIGVPAIVQRPSVHARRAHAIEKKAAAKDARRNANEKERTRLEEARLAVALDFDALDNLSWMPKATRQGSGPAPATYSTSTDSNYMDFKPRPPKLGIGAKAQPNPADEDTGMRKVRTAVCVLLNKTRQSIGSQFAAKRTTVCMSVLETEYSLTVPRVCCATFCRY